MKPQGSATDGRMVRLCAECVGLFLLREAGVHCSSVPPAGGAGLREAHLRRCGICGPAFLAGRRFFQGHYTGCAGFEEAPPLPQLGQAHMAGGGWRRRWCGRHRLTWWVSGAPGRPAAPLTSKGGRDGGRVGVGAGARARVPGAHGFGASSGRRVPPCRSGGFLVGQPHGRFAPPVAVVRQVSPLPPARAAHRLERMRLLRDRTVDGVRMRAGEAPAEHTRSSTRQTGRSRLMSAIGSKKSEIRFLLSRNRIRQMREEILPVGGGEFVAVSSDHLQAV